jgi:hypothetical protein
VIDLFFHVCAAAVQQGHPLAPASRTQIKVLLVVSGSLPFFPVHGMFFSFSIFRAKQPTSMSHVVLLVQQQKEDKGTDHPGVCASPSPFHWTDPLPVLHRLHNSNGCLL